MFILAVIFIYTQDRMSLWYPTVYNKPARLYISQTPYQKMSDKVYKIEIYPISVHLTDFLPPS